MKRGVAIAAVIVVLVLLLSGSKPEDVIDSGSPNPFLGKLPSNINYWYSLINGALLSLYGGGDEGATLNDAALITAIAWQESGFLENVVYGETLGKDGEIGMCQILPKTATGLGWPLIDLYNPQRNAQCAFALVREIRARNAIDPGNSFYEESSMSVILGGYNGGIAAEKNPSLVSGYVNSVYDRYEAIAIHFGLIVVINP